MYAIWVALKMSNVRASIGLAACMSVDCELFTSYWAIARLVSGTTKKYNRNASKLPTSKPMHVASSQRRRSELRSHVLSMPPRTMSVGGEVTPTPNGLVTGALAPTVMRARREPLSSGWSGYEFGLRSNCDMGSVLPGEKLPRQQADV